MDLNVQPQDESIRKIEDIIDIQKAKGNFVSRQVSFSLPSDSDNTNANLAKSLESGLSNTTTDGFSKKKNKKFRSKRNKSPLPDVISWPSDSDITVLRMKLCITGSDLKENIGNIVPGDGLHQPDSSSMVNLATLILQSQPPSKHSLLEEYLLPLSSWESAHDNELERKEPLFEEDQSHEELGGSALKEREATCSHEKRIYDPYISSKDSTFSKTSAKSKMARFLRLYFCPCCTCLYKLEVREDQSAYFSKFKESPNTDFL